ncbi:MAG: hypothetical protein R3B06_08380 [Kofleriaceae bacterium]
MHLQGEDLAERFGVGERPRLVGPGGLGAQDGAAQVGVPMLSCDRDAAGATRLHLGHQAAVPSAVVPSPTTIGRGGLTFSGATGATRSFWKVAHPRTARQVVIVGLPVGQLGMVRGVEPGPDAETRHGLGDEHDQEHVLDALEAAIAVDEVVVDLDLGSELCWGVGS